MFGVHPDRTSMLHHPEWAALVELPVLQAVLAGIFETEDFHCSGGFGVFTLPGAGYQPLHVDGGAAIPSQAAAPRSSSLGGGGGGGGLDARDLPPHNVSVGFPIQPMTRTNGATRVWRNPIKRGS